MDLTSSLNKLNHTEIINKTSNIVTMLADLTAQPTLNFAVDLGLTVDIFTSLNEYDRVKSLMTIIATICIVVLQKQ